jgi:hypothetical protein
MVVVIIILVKMMHLSSKHEYNEQGLLHSFSERKKDGQSVSYCFWLSCTIAYATDNNNNMCLDYEMSCCITTTRRKVREEGFKLPNVALLQAMACL